MLHLGLPSDLTSPHDPFSCPGLLGLSWGRSLAALAEDEISPPPGVDPATQRSCPLPGIWGSYALACAPARLHLLSVACVRACQMLAVVAFASSSSPSILQIALRGDLLVFFWLLCERVAAQAFGSILAMRRPKEGPLGRPISRAKCRQSPWTRPSVGRALLESHQVLARRCLPIPDDLCAISAAVGISAWPTRSRLASDLLGRRISPPDRRRLAGSAC